MSTYAWVITKDHVAEPDGLPSPVGRSGPSSATTEQLALASEGRKFRLLDADRTICFEGRIWNVEPGNPHDFGPLDDFGRPEVGAVDIQYLEGGKWVTL